MKFRKGPFGISLTSASIKKVASVSPDPEIRTNLWPRGRTTSIKILIKFNIPSIIIKGDQKVQYSWNRELCFKNQRLKTLVSPNLLFFYGKK